MTIPPDAAAPQKWTHRYFPGESLAKMVLGLVGGASFAVCHHFFYLSLQGNPPPDTMVDLGGLGGAVSHQQINLAMGTFFAFMVKVFLGVALSVSQEQWSWKAAKTRPASLSLLDNLFASRTSLFSAMHARLWARYPLPMFLALLVWLLPTAAVFTPATLTIRSVPLKDQAKMHVPRPDFASLNFASVTDQSDGLDGEFHYAGPQDSTWIAVIESMVSKEILTFPASHPNSTWLLDFYGPALSCKNLSTTEGLGANITQQVNQTKTTGAYTCWVYLAWTPSSAFEKDNVSGYLPFSSGLNGSYTIRSDTLGGSPLSLFLAIFPSTGSECLDPSKAIPDSIIVQCTLYNASYTANFSFVNGFQTIAPVHTSSFNDSNAVSGFGRLYSGATSTQSLTLAGVEALAYQSVFDVFQSMLLGSVYIEFGGEIPQKTFNTKLGKTALINAREASFLQPFADTDPLPWNGINVATSNDRTRGAVKDTLEEMFRNVTISLATQNLLNPNYSSPYAPQDPIVTTLTYQNQYQYSAALLWAAYGTAIGITTLGVIIGLWVMLSSGASYSSKFSTVLRVSHNLHLSEPLEMKDASGKDPLPPHLKRMEVAFPPDDVEEGSTRALLQLTDEDHYGGGYNSSDHPART